MPNAVEEAAIKWVIDYGKSKGRTAVDTRKRKGASTDIESPPLSIEVKAFSKTCRGEQLWLEPAQYREASTNPNFRLYVVENVTLVRSRSASSRRNLRKRHLSSAAADHGIGRVELRRDWKKSALYRWALAEDVRTWLLDSEGIWLPDLNAPIMEEIMSRSAESCLEGGTSAEPQLWEKSAPSTTTCRFVSSNPDE